MLGSLRVGALALRQAGLHSAVGISRQLRSRVAIIFPKLALTWESAPVVTPAINSGVLLDVDVPLAATMRRLVTAEVKEK
jgi:hypothetical protein